MEKFASGDLEATPCFGNSDGNAVRHAEYFKTVGSYKAKTRTKYEAKIEFNRSQTD